MKIRISVSEQREGLVAGKIQPFLVKLGHHRVTGLQ